MKKIQKLISCLIAVIMTATSVISVYAERTAPTPDTIANYVDLFTEGEFISDNNEVNGALKYFLYVPENYDENYDYPILTFLHGAGERGVGGTNLTSSTLMTHYFTEENMRDYPCIILAPECPTTAVWADATLGDAWTTGDYRLDNYTETVYTQMVIELIARVENTYSTDKSRRYITGVSMGGYGTWATIMYHPDVFAAAAPVCGGCDSTKAENLKDLSIWTFHGLDDTTVPPTGTQAMYEQMVAIGNPTIKYNVDENGNVTTEENLNGASEPKFKYTAYADVGHGSWNFAFEEPDYFSWMFSQTNPDYEDISGYATRSNGETFTLTSSISANLASGATAIDCGVGIDSGENCSLASIIDGNINTFWKTNQDKKYEMWCGVKLSSAKTVNKAAICFDGATRPNASTAGYTVQYSNDGTTWTDVSDAAYSYDQRRSGYCLDYVTFDEVTATYFRVNILTNSNNKNYSSKVCEFELYHVNNITTKTENEIVNLCVDIAGEKAFDDITDGLNLHGYYESGRSDEAAIDGDIDTSWQYSGDLSNNTDLTDSCYLGADFGNTYNISSTVYYMGDSARAATNETEVIGMYLEYSTDGVNYYKLSEVSNYSGTYAEVNGKGVFTFTFDTISARYIKATFTKANNKYYPQVFEWEVFGRKEDYTEHNMIFDEAGAQYRENRNDSTKYDLRFVTVIDKVFIDSKLGEITEFGILMGRADQMSENDLTVDNYKSGTSQIRSAQFGYANNLTTNLTDTYSLYASIIGISDVNVQYMARAYFIIDGTVYYTNTVTKSVADGL